MFAQKRQVIKDVCQKKMEMEVYRELDFLKDLQHAFICNAHFAFHDNTYLYLIMDIALGGDLRFHINNKLKEKKNFSAKETKWFISCIIIALDYLHDSGVLHRDIKVRPSEERSDEIAKPSLMTKTARACSSVQDTLPP